ncbi:MULTISPECIES: NAD(P)H-dependent oxidoreductase [unclassified Caballeronia]|uniref:NAD(P)H-dependent oxidoreductase n=1 Tax=unclassified Caballeronia TaxID=2646786 RepID=UPI0028570A6F|nr:MULTISPECIES: NAD(P)H-dependent oxidoreductase [unclassified Caballeronia]MDR5777172.1 NAD(P)H-dependent oxidoreductase [Caballeronia sp. LZ002]MDR5852603.1 NAD(P)H-dependent oxidoreductase [Caballeronia sp. LZ003]
MNAERSVLIVLGHPDTKGFGGALAAAYEKGLRRAGCAVDLMHLGALDFDATPRGRPGPLEDDLAEARVRITRAKHLVLIYPTWLGAMPARMKGFFERVFGDNFAFRFKPESLLPERLLSGRSADVLVTMDTPPLLYRFVLGAPGHKLVRSGILAPAGISPIRVFSFGSLKKSSDEQRAAWLKQIETRGTTRGRALLGQ